MQANVFILGHNAPGFESRADVNILREIGRGGAEPLANVYFDAIIGKRDAIHRTNIHAGITLDASLCSENRLHIAVQTTLRFLECEIGVEPQLNLDLDALQSDRYVLQWHFVAHFICDRVVVTPLVNAHFLADEIHHRRGPFGRIFTKAEFVDRDRRLVPVRDGPDNILRAECGVAAEKYIRQR